MKSKKQQLRKQCDLMWKHCVIKRWGQNSCISGIPANDCHHFFAKGAFAFLRYNIDNGVPLTRAEHIAHHWRFDPTIHARIVAKRGNQWYNGLERISKEKHISFETIGYYENKIKELKEYFENKQKTTP